MAFTKVTNTGIGSTGTVLLQNLDVIGIATAGFGVSTVDVFTTGITTFANATDSTSTTTGSVVVSGGVGIAGSLNVGGSVSVGGTLTYEDVTNVDSVGIITARSNILVGSGITLSPDGNIFAVGVVTTPTLKLGSGVTISSSGDSFATGVTTVGSLDISTGFIKIPDSIIHVGDANTKIRFPDTDTISFETNSSDRLRIKSDGKIGIGTAGPTGLLHLAAGGGSCILEMQRTGTNTTGNVGAINFTASDGHSVASIGAYGDGDNEGAYINFKTTSAASANSPFTSTTERMKITSDGYVEGNINVPCWFGRQDTAHNVASGAWTTILNLGNSVINPSMNNGGWNESTGVFTVQTGQAGLYYVYGQTAIDDVQDNDVVRAGFSKNDGTIVLYSQQRCIDQGANTILNSGLMAQTVSLAVGDTIKLQVYHNEGSTEPTEPTFCFFGGYRLSS